jgi:hypothetical protein
LDEYIDSGESSDSQDRPDPINSGHPVHDAVRQVELHYPSEKLPATPRIHWLDLLDITRGKRETNRPNQEAIAAAWNLLEWAKKETQITGDKPNSTPHNALINEHGKVLDWASRNLKGKQRRVLELAIEGGGQISIADIAMDAQISWHAPFGDSFNGIRKAVNQKLRSAGLPFVLERHDNNARLARKGQK